MPVKYIGISEKVCKEISPIPFSGIKVLDARFDTSCVGFFNNYFLPSTQKLNFKNSGSNEIENYFIKNYRTQADSENCGKLFILIEKLFLRNAENDSINKTQYGYNKDVSRFDVIIKAKLLVQKDSNFYALREVDSVMIFRKEIRGRENFFLEKTLDVLMQNFIDKKPQEIKAGNRSFKMEEIQQYENQKKELPILLDSSYGKGIYKSFEEFKKNKPSIENFELGKDEKTDALYVKDETGSEYLLRNFWGFSDGHHLFINEANNFFQLNKIENTFYVYGFNSFIKKTKLNIGNMLLSSVLFGSAQAGPPEVKYKGVKVSLQLDMESGELF